MMLLIVRDSAENSVPVSLLFLHHCLACLKDKGQLLLPLYLFLRKGDFFYKKSTVKVNRA
jgi:hypothetical protein